MILQRLPQLPRLLLAWVLVLGVVAPSLWSAETVCPGVWKLRALSGPPARDIHAMAYDSVRRQVVLFGGRGTRGDPTSNRLGDTWEWDGTVWMHTANTGPSPRAYMAMDYDPTRQRVVVFGGAGSRMNPFQDTHDTWEWDGTVWTKVATSGPTARNAHGVAYDSARQRLVLFGGGVTFGGLFDDTWEWDGTAWTQRAPTVMPSLREAFGMAYDRVRGRVVLFGGIDLTGTVFGDTWAWDGTVWQQVASTCPTARLGLAMAYDSARGRVVLFGGNDAAGTFFGDTWEWDGVTWTQVASIGPSPRGAARATYDSVRGRVVLFGGDDQGFSQGLRHDTWEWVGPIYACSGRATGDLNCDGSIDRDDLTILYAARRSDACGPNDPRDLNHDGRITKHDARRLVRLCTHLGCATP